MFQGPSERTRDLSVRRGARSATLAAAVLLASLWAGCSPEPKDLVYDLARRAPVAERWSELPVLLFGTPSCEPHLQEGFYREAVAAGEPFLWSRGEAEVALDFEAPAPRAAILDVAPYEGVSAQSVSVLLNAVPVDELRLADVRSRYLLPLPVEAQQPGENRLRFVFAETASPADRDETSLDERQLAAAFYSLTVGARDDERLSDLLRRGAPRPFGVEDTSEGPALEVVGPAAVRFALRLPEAAELRFTPELPLAARAAAASASFRVTVELEDDPGHERELWSRVLQGNDAGPGEVAVRLPGRAGQLARVSLLVGEAEEKRFAWGTWRAPRVLGRGGGDPFEVGVLPGDEDERADPLRSALKESNVVLVVLDAARARQFGAYGYERATTPAIDAIADDGIVFEKAYTPAVYTLGAMSSVWTSQYPDRHHGDVSFSSPLPTDRLTLAEVLSGEGIFTAGFVATAVPGGFNGFDRGFDEFHELWQEIGSRGDVFRDVLPRWLAAHTRQRFFAYLHYREPHFPYDPPPPFDTRFGPDGPLSREARRDMEFFKDVNQGRRSFSEEERADLVRLYDGNLAYVDQEIGALRAMLEAAGVWDRTVLIVTADHGEELFEHGWIGHNVYVFEPSTHIPLIVRLPDGVQPRGTRVSELVDLLDIAPTVVDVFGVRDKGGADKEFQGQSLLPVMAGARGKALVVSRTVWDRPRYALRDGRWTYIYDTATGEERLFDTDADPGETENRAEGFPLRTAYSRETLHQWMRSVFEPRGGAATPVEMNRAQCEALKALGYVPAEQPCPGE